MSDIINKISYLQGTKNLFKTKLGIVESIPFRDYVQKIESAVEEYVRPADWLTMPTINSGEEKCLILCPIYEIPTNFVALQVTGDYIIDWGDGTVENFASGIKAEHTYSYGAIPENTICSRGYKQVIITITPQVPGTFNTIIFSSPHSNSPLIFPYNTPSKNKTFLDIHVSGPNISAIDCGSLLLLENFIFHGQNVITSFNRTFSGCRELRNVSIYTGVGTDFYYMFQGCQSLRYVPQLDTSNGTDMSGMFQSCNLLQTIPEINTSKTTNFSRMFENCYSLKTIPLLNTSSGTNFLYMFTGCYSLRSIPLLDTSSGTNFSGMFYNCYMLKEVPLINTINGTNFYQMFSSCITLQTIPLFDFNNGTDFSYMFSTCSSLQMIPNLNVSKGTTFSNMFSYCYQLQYATLLNITQNIAYADYGSCLLSRQAIIAIFNALGTVSGKTIKLTGNYGAASLTEEDKLIATNKGWTITI